MSKRIFKLALVPALLIGSCSAVFAAKAIDLNNQDVSSIKSLLVVAKPGVAASVGAGDKLIEQNRDVDFNQTLHVRVKQTHAGYPVFASDAIIHVPKAENNKSSLMTLVAAPKAKTTMDGTIYQDLAGDLRDTPAVVFSESQAKKAEAYVQTLLKKKMPTVDAKESESKLMVYVDDNNKAHWVFYTSFYFPSVNGRMPSKPVYIIDAATFEIYREWNDVKQLNAVDGGGIGGNEKRKLIYDGARGNLAKLQIQRDDQSKTCYLLNDDAVVFDYHNAMLGVVLASKKPTTPFELHKDKMDPWMPASFPCEVPSSEHNNVYWNARSDEVNGGYSPNNDALYNGAIVKELYKQWYNTEMLVKDDKTTPMKLVLISHVPDPEAPATMMLNAFWDPYTSKIYLGDGGAADFPVLVDGKVVIVKDPKTGKDTLKTRVVNFYPLTSLDVISHEVSHGFTSQHSDLIYDRQSGGMNEAFSDMAAQAAESFAYGTSSWMIGAEVAKEADVTFRYMDDPEKDGFSIGNAANYKNALNVHYTSGVYNRAFYLLANSPDWNVRKAFRVMIQANAHYWVPASTFNQGACGVIKATKDFNYDTAAVVKAFNAVGVSTKECV